ncbi:MAG: uncharacterized protein PWP47_848 [Synergistaceae bacterium]|jgi:hypothetical protein|nr:uncharacterized protein [Synergistaceae bacterium]
MSRSFAVFFSLYVLVYGSMHVYVYFKLRSAIGRGWKWTALFIMVSLAMIVGARALWLFDFGDARTLRKVLSYSGYVWMAFMFMTFAWFVLIDLARLLFYILDSIVSTRFGDLLGSPKLRAAVAVSAALSICLYGWFEALNVRTVTITIPTSKLSRGADRVRIAQLSDVHLGGIIQEERLAAMLDAVRKAEPDMLVVTGDLVDGAMEERRPEVALFRSLKLPHGIYAVTGNHEYYAGIDQSLAFMEHAGLRVLRNEAVRAGGVILAGVDDKTGNRYGRPAAQDASVLAGMPPNRFVVLLKHQPLIDHDAVGLFDLQLSGHTHGGQIWPFYWVTRAVYDYRPGLRAIAPPERSGQAHAAPLKRQSRIYVNNGAGTWGPPIRFLTPPEVTIIDIVRE